MLTPITVVFDAVNPDGTSAVGGFTFTLSSPLVDSSTNESVVPVPLTATVISNQLISTAAGNPPLVLLATDDPTTVPTGAYYLVKEDLSAGSLPPWKLYVPHTAPGGVLNLASQRPVG